MSDILRLSGDYHHTVRLDSFHEKFAVLLKRTVQYSTKQCSAVQWIVWTNKEVNKILKNIPVCFLVS